MFWKEIRGVLRGLRKNLGFTTLTVGILALGMGASIAVFSIINSVLLKPLPFPDPDRMFTVWDVPPPQMKLGFDEVPVHGREFQFIASDTRAFRYVAAFLSDQFNLNGATDAERVDGVRASADFFKVLGIQPQSGRTFLAEEDHPGSEHEVVIGYSLWRRRFASDPALVGKTIRLNSEAYTVIGVMPRDSHFLAELRCRRASSFPSRPSCGFRWHCRPCLAGLRSWRWSHDLARVSQRNKPGQICCESTAPGSSRTRAGKDRTSS